jgi:outer membrane protein assembly factor BamE (lipoprotein component of BamABCDE complex)
MRSKSVAALPILICFSTVAGCAFQRAQLAQDAQGRMVGMSKEQILACMGPPQTKAAEGATEIWSYASGDGRTTVVGTGVFNTSASISGNRNYASGTASTASTAVATSRQRHCTVNVTMNEGRVSQVNYVGPTGGLLTAGEQCAFAVQNCAASSP